MKKIIQALLLLLTMLLGCITGCNNDPKPDSKIEIDQTFGGGIIFYVNETK